MEKNKENKEPEFYDVQLGCRNCLDIKDHKIPYGKLIINYTAETQCDKCGCYGTFIAVQKKAEA